MHGVYGEERGRERESAGGKEKNDKKDGNALT